MNRDLTNNIEVVESIRPQVATAGVDGETVDLRGGDSVAFSVSVGAITGTGGDATVTLEESSNGSDWTDVADADILGTEPTLAADTAYQFGYIGGERYVRPVFGLGTETNVAVSVTATKGHLDNAPADYSVESVL
jgi:hypothetical protein